MFRLGLNIPHYWVNILLFTLPNAQWIMSLFLSWLLGTDTTTGPMSVSETVTSNFFIRLFSQQQVDSSHTYTNQYSTMYLRGTFYGSLELSLCNSLLSAILPYEFWWTLVFPEFHFHLLNSRSPLGSAWVFVPYTTPENSPRQWAGTVIELTLFILHLFQISLPSLPDIQWSFPLFHIFCLFLCCFKWESKSGPCPLSWSGHKLSYHTFWLSKTWFQKHSISILTYRTAISYASI